MPEPVRVDLLYSDSDSDAPLASRFKPAKRALKEPDSDSDSDSPLSQLVKNASPAKKARVEKSQNGQKIAASPKAQSVKGSKVNGKPRDSLDKPNSTPKIKKESSTTAKKIKKEAKTNGKNVAKSAAKATAKNTAKVTVKSETPKVKAKSESPGLEDDQEDQEDDQVYKWWEQIDNMEDNSVKWTSLEHNGVLFPPPYEPLPADVKLIYDGHKVVLPLEAEEVAGFFGAMLNTDHAANPVFQRNFFEDFLDVLKKAGGAKNAAGEPVKIKEFAKCDFSLIFNHYDYLRQEKKLMNKAQKKQLKEDKDKLEEPFKTCIMDGRKQPVGNFRIEPPGLFRGRGAHPKTGKLKARVQPEQVIINIGKDAKVPEPPEGHHWAEVRHDNTVSWLAHWKENINGNSKYVMLAQSSFLKGMSDYNKFEKARELKKHISRIRQDYRKELKDPLMINRQRATATYLIDVFALRAGGEKGDDEADTVGCCSLRYEHVELVPPTKVIFDFLGKDSIRYHQEVEVDRQVFKNLMIFKKAPKTIGDDIFDRLDPSILNKHLQNYMPGLTAKVFRTYNASKTMQDQLALIKNEGTVGEKVVAFNAANRAVAILCNHQRTVAKTHEATVGKIEDKLLEIKWNRIRVKKMILQLEPKLKKKDPDYFAEIDELTKDTIKDLVMKIVARERERVEKKFVRDNEKLTEEGQKPMPDSELKTRLEAVKTLEQGYTKELKSGKPEVKSLATVEKLKAQVEKLDQRYTNTQLQLKDKEDNSQVSLGTSKMNYIDPRLTVMFAKKYNVPIEKLFTKTLREKFNWAIQSADENWTF